MNQRIASTIDSLETFMADKEDANPLPREAARFVHGLVLALRAKRVLEIGTSFGYSGLWIAGALVENRGLLVTIDRDSYKHEEARARFCAAGLEPYVEFVQAQAIDAVKSIAGPFDFVLNDADKQYCTAYVEALMPKLNDRALILTDNTRTHPAELAGFLDWIRNHPRFASIEVPVGNGMEMSVFRRPS